MNFFGILYFLKCLVHKSKFTLFVNSIRLKLLIWLTVNLTVITAIIKFMLLYINS